MKNVQFSTAKERGAPSSKINVVYLINLPATNKKGAG